MSKLIACFVLAACCFLLSQTPACKQMAEDMKAQSEYNSTPHLYKTVDGMQIYRFKDDSGYWVYINVKGGTTWQQPVCIAGKYCHVEMKSSIEN